MGDLGIILTPFDAHLKICKVAFGLGNRQGVVSQVG
jgi:hypothetical protein